MIAAGRTAGTSALAKEVSGWIRAEAGDPELQNRVTVALDEIKAFISRHQTDLERRKSRLIQTTGFKDETRSMEAALGKIHQLVTGGRNISIVSAAIGGFLDTYKEDATFDGEHVRTQLGDARDDFFCRFHDSIRGTRLSELLDILYFMPYSHWRSRGIERRNFRSPSAVEMAKLLEDFRQRGVDVDGIDAVQLAAMIRIRLGITPRMDYHRLPANKIAERLTSEEVIAQCASGVASLSDSFCRTTAGILANLRRWSTDGLGSAAPQAPPEVEAEMLQLAYLAGDIIRIRGTANERAADYLWLLSTVIAGDHTVVKDVLTAPIGMHFRHPSIRERIVGVKSYLDDIAARVDGILVSRWSEAKEALGSLTLRTEALASKSKPDFREFTELGELKEKRSDVVKALIKFSDAMQLVEPSLLERPASSGAAAGRSLAGQVLALDPAQLRDRNFRISEETKAIARQELEKLRLLILRITAISRGGFADSGTGTAPPGRRENDRRARQTSDGVELTELAGADLQAKLCGTLLKVATSLREFRSKVDGVRRRILKGELQHALNVLYEKTRKAADFCDSADQGPGDAARTSPGAESIAALLREIMAAQTNVGARINAAKLTPAEKQPLATLMNAMKLRLGDDIRDIDRLRTELAERSGGPERNTGGDPGPAAADVATVPEAAAVEAPVAPAAAADGEARDQVAVAEAADAAPEDPARTAAVDKIAALVAAVNSVQRPVKALMTALNRTFASDPSDSSTIRAAASALMSGITEARDVMTANAMQIEALAADYTLPTDQYVERFDRWSGQLTALERETERLLRSMGRVADIHDAVTAAAALEQGIADTLRPPPGERNRAEPFVPVRQRCRDALATIADGLRRVREAQHSLAAARDAEWRIMKTAPRYVGSLCSELATLAGQLHDTHGRIETIYNHFKSDRPRTR